MYALFHADYTFERWHVFVTYLMVSWMSCFVVVFGNRLLPLLNDIGLFLIIAGGVISIIVCAVMPSQTGNGYASDEFVWKNWVNSTGWSSDGLTFLLGMLNGAYAMGNPGKSTSQGIATTTDCHRFCVSPRRRDPTVSSSILGHLDLLTNL